MNMKRKAGFTMTALALLLTGCGGGSSGALGISSIFGKVSDGYVSGATVKFDIDDSGVCGDSANENALGHVVTTDLAGNFAYPPAIAATHLVCSSGGTDISTGQPFVGNMLAPPGSTQVTPLTTLTVAIIAAAPVGAKPTPAQAATTVATKFGLPAGTDVLNNDPIALAATNPKLAQTTTAVQALLIQAAANVSAAATNSVPTNAQTAALYSAAVTGVAAAIAAPAAPVVDLTTAPTATINTLVTSVVSNTVTAAQNLVQGVAPPGATAAQITALQTKATAVNNAFAANAANTATPAIQSFQAAVVGVNQATLVPANVAAVASTAITNVTQTVATQSAAVLIATPAPNTVSPSLQAQTVTTTTSTTATVASTGLLDNANAALAVSPAALTQLTTIAVAQSAVTPGTVAPALTTAVNAGTIGAVTTTTTAPAAPAVTAPPPPPNDLPIASASVTGTGNCTGLQVAACPVGAGPVTVTGPLVSSTVNFGTASGTPASPTVTASFNVVSAVAGDARTLSGNISGLTVVGGVLTVPATATATINGTHANGTTSAATATGTTISPWISANFATGGSATLNIGTMLTNLGAQVPVGQTNTGFSTLNLQKGNFYVTVSWNGVSLSSAGFPVTSQTYNVIVN